MFLCPQSLVLCAHCAVITFSDSTGPCSIGTEARTFQFLGSGRTGGAMSFCNMLGRRAGKTSLPGQEASALPRGPA